MGPKTAVVRVTGELDHDESAELRDTVLAVLAPGRLTCVDLRDVTFLGGLAIRALVEAIEGAARLGASVVLLHPPPMAERLLALCGLSRYVGVERPEAASDRCGRSAGA